jgi:hypothetical protein
LFDADENTTAPTISARITQDPDKNEVGKKSSTTEEMNCSVRHCLGNVPSGTHHASVIETVSDSSGLKTVADADATDAD